MLIPPPGSFGSTFWYHANTNRARSDSNDETWSMTANASTADEGEASQGNSWLPGENIKAKRAKRKAWFVVCEDMVLSWRRRRKVRSTEICCKIKAIEKELLLLPLHNPLTCSVTVNSIDKSTVTTSTQLKCWKVSQDRYDGRKDEESHSKQECSCLESCLLWSPKDSRSK